MSSPSGESDVDSDNNDGVPVVEDADHEEDFGDFTDALGDQEGDSELVAPVATAPDHELDEDGTPARDATTFDGYGRVKKMAKLPDYFNSDEPLSPGIASVASPDDSLSIPDDTPSIQGSLLSSPGSSVPGSRPSPSKRHSMGALRPFERRFSSRLSMSPSPLQSPRVGSPAFMTAHSRQSSITSQVLLQNQDEPETPQPPWEVVRWTKLKKMTGQVFSEVGKRNFGRATCLCVGASIIIGTSKGFILVFDYHQTLKSIIGPGTKAIECGAVTSLAISADHTTVAGGHANGNIFTWELARPAKPFLHIPPMERSVLDNRRQDGHIRDNAILHLGFLGTRHTALVSADDGGMAFSHLATRGLGAVGRTVKTTRILGRYPLSAKSLERPRKPSSVLAFAPLPLGNVEQPTDGLGLTALLTPYLLVIVSTTPIAQTQHKNGRPKELAPHSTLSGCLAWFPAVKLKNTNERDQRSVSKTKLVYCWSNILTILDVEVPETYENDKPPDLNFRPRSRWRGEEAIVAVQWLSRSVLGVLTISQRLVILEDTNGLRMTDSFDLIQKHIYHQDLFSKQLRPVVEQLDEDDASMHGVVADAFYMSLKAYKGRLFLLGFNDVSIGTLSNWADRLLALMEEGDVIAAINLATSYYNGDTDKLTVGLPDNDTARHAIVREKLIEMISASLRYMFSRKQDEHEVEKEPQLTEFASSCFAACLSLEELDILFEEVYEAFEQDGSEGIFFETLEPYISDEAITSVPPVVLKDMITYYASQGRTSRLEEIICRLDTMTMDLDQVTILCRQYSLYEALIYVWNRALNDYVTPLIDLLSLIKVINYEDDDQGVDPKLWDSAMKLFPYLAYTLTGRVYPGGANLDDLEATRAKSDIYGFLFSGKVTDWPKGSGHNFTTRTDKGPEPNFPYLRLVLSFDTGSFMSMLNEAFEDSFLNGDQNQSSNGSVNGGHKSSLTPTRQYIVNILLGVMTNEEFDAEDIIYFYMFLARNLPKFPQYIMLPGTTLHKILIGLCNFPSGEIQDDCQLSVEYLLSVYHPSDIEGLIPLLEKAGFYRVLKSIYSGTKQYPKLIETYFKDIEDQDGVFECIGDCLRPSRGLSKRQIQDVHRVIIAYASNMARLSASKTASTVKSYAPELLDPVINALEDEPDCQYYVLRALVEPDRERDGKRQLGSGLPSGFIERYVELMCRFNPSHVSDFVSFLHSGDLKLESVLPALEKSGIVDAAVILMARDGLVGRAMGRLVEHLGTLETALVGLIKASVDSPDSSNTEEAVDDLLEAVQKYAKVGIWLCQGHTKTTDAQLASSRPRRPINEQTEEDLESHELIWLDLVDTVVRITKNVTSTLMSLESPESTSSSALSSDNITTSLRSTVQQLFSSLLASTAAKPRDDPTTHSHASSTPKPTKRPTTTPSPSFLRILRAFLDRASRSSPSLSDLRAVLSDIFSAYTFEETILSLANRFLDKDAFSHVSEVYERRQHGWRPRGQVCEICKRRAWGPGAGSSIWEAWERKEEEDQARRTRRMIEMGGGEAAARLARGKGKAEEPTSSSGSSTPSIPGANGKGKGKGKAGADDEDEHPPDNENEDLGPLIVFACRHLFHRTCLEKAQIQKREQEHARHQRTASEAMEESGAGGGSGRAFKCPLVHAS